MKNLHAIYSDGNYFPRAKKSGFGGYIEDSKGDILVEYTEQIKQPNYIFNFELFGIIRGLQLAQAMGLKNVISYCDDKTTMLRMNEIMLNGGNVSHLPLNAKPELFLQIVELSKQFENIKFQYIPRSQNKHSDSLSRRYASLMEQNFMRQYEEALSLSENVFSKKTKPAKRIFFSHPNLIKMKDKNNPFLVAPIRNRRSRKISRVEQEEKYQYLFIETIKKNENEFSLLAFHYPNGEHGEKKLIQKNSYNNTDLTITHFCDFLSQSIEDISKVSNKSLWLYSNATELNQFFEQKEKLPKDSFLNFSQIYDTFNLLPKLMYHYLPFKHEFSPEIAVKEAKKDSLTLDLENVDYLMDQLQKGVLGREQNKYFGKLIRYQLRSYRKILSRELNDVEKQEIIQNTTTVLENHGLKNLPKMPKI